MADIKTFHLPDLGEGLPDATIVEWLVKVGGTVRLDEPMVSMETAKAVVEVPSPFSGKLVKVHGDSGDVIATGAALAEFELDPNMPQRAEAESTGHHHGPPKAAATPGKGVGAEAPDHKGVVASDEGGEIASGGKAPRADEGTVVGAMQSSDRVHAEQATSIGGVKAVPAVRALAKKLGVDLARVSPSGAGGVVTLQDVKSAAAAGTARIGAAPAGAASAAIGRQAPASIAAEAAPAAQRTTLSAAGKPMRTTPPTVAATGQPEQLKGVRRNMARVMAAAHAAVVPTTLSDDADIHAWLPGNDITVRLVRAIVRAAKMVPALNAWFDGDNLTRTLHPHVDIGIAVDTDDGLFVPALRNADMLDAAGVRAAVNRLRAQVEDRSIPPSELAGYTISLSNFGVFAGRYATPVVVPPCVAIVAAGKGRHQMTPVMGGFESHRVIPLSLTFDHRAATGGEAARFLKAMLDDLALAQ
ncbi:dihydrolipoamide acetyltransferase family protein [Dokdonella fugitiva]|jgi:pyruvate dehydrogenase E2 component (dihydrolipoamide acetyltransferase)|uniref:Dihydrolipoamide acetyltransferase component of pyruvate dehydrogenase complex n=1 Tax=Dokdonella fugitiva TaxID=328517 RepID=A0A4R2IJA4_9GAMM|nr:dihydrolipoamide acetyltransferase family protein [Dokdonella fugitiva]MBA8882409.1 pyruvate dehydrogenase E2 component (dihydrolipoamide acetyltransferase) [Dokdonella fugitiva]TCO42795.1 pyruvate dehydrogenase E2 component (dihydrolipoamide acetyltransferase) [Dokdonella fugitiva]